MFLESQKLYDKGEDFEPGGVPEGYYETEEGEPAIRREGTDITIAAYGATVYKALEAADVLAEKYGLSAEVIDLRFVAPLNYDKLIASVKKTGRLVLTSDAVERGSFLNTVAANVQTLAFDALDAPIAVVASRNGITPDPRWSRTSSRRSPGSSTRFTSASSRCPATCPPRSTRPRPRSRA